RARPAAVVRDEQGVPRALQPARPDAAAHAARVPGALGRVAQDRRGRGAGGAFRPRRPGAGPGRGRADDPGDGRERERAGAAGVRDGARRGVGEDHRRGAHAARAAAGAAERGMMGAERLQKILAHAGVASRRKAEELIEAGHVSVNGKVVRELGSKADIAEDVIQVDGRTIRETQDKVYYVLYKPAGCVTTLSDPENRPTIKTYLEDIPERVYPVGRLDYDVEGALIVTNDGDLAYSMMHPKFGVRRTYLAKVHGVPTPAQIERLLGGVRLE